MKKPPEKSECHYEGNNKECLDGKEPDSVIPEEKNKKCSKDEMNEQKISNKLSPKAHNEIPNFSNLR